LTEYSQRTGNIVPTIVVGYDGSQAARAGPDLAVDQAVPEVGVCGERGGDPESIRFFHRAGLDYVPCSPFHMRIARVAAAQAAMA
jgi:PEP-utilising enzyme, PEP-binding domain